MPPEAVLHGRYEVERELDRNALVVRSRQDPGSALCVLRYPQVDDSLALEVELRLLETFEHPHLARVLEVGRSDDGQLFFLQERVEGENFFSWAIGRDAAQLARVFAQYLSVLGSVHARGYVAGGERPPRLMVEGGDGANPRLRVIDLGGLLHEHTRAEGVNAHASMLAPERRVGATIDRRANLYEAGVILYELLAGSSHSGMQLPVAGVAPAGSGSFPPLADLAPTLPVPLAAYVMVLLRPVPQERPRSVAVALDALRAAAQLPLPVELGPQGLLPPPWLGRESGLLEALAWLRPLTQPQRSGRTPPQAQGPLAQAALLVVHGEPGCGRSAFLDEVAVRLDHEGVLVIGASCGDRPGAAGSLARVLRRILQDRSVLEQASATVRWAMSELLPDVVQAPTERPPALADTEQERLRLLDALAEPLLQRARRQPTLLVLRRLDAAGPLELELIEHLARRAHVAATHSGRESADSEPKLRLLVSAGAVDGSSRLAELLTRTYARGLELGALSQRDMVRVVQERLGVPLDAIPLELRDSLAAAARGLPGRVLQVIDDHRRGASGQLRPATSLTDERFARAREVDPCDVLPRLALLQRPTSRWLLAADGPDDPRRLDAVFEGLLNQRLIEPLMGWRYRLASPELGELILRVTTRTRQRELARQLTEARAAQVEELPLRPEPQLELARLAACSDDDGVAHAAALDRHGPGATAHLESLGAWELAAELHEAIAWAEGEDGWQWRRRQARALHLAGDHAEAALLCRELLEVGDDWPPAARGQVWRTLVEARWAEGRYDEAGAALDAAREALDEPGCSGAAALGLAELLTVGGSLRLDGDEADEAKALCEAAQEVLKRASPGPETTRLRVQLLIQLAQVASIEQDFGEAEQLLKASLALQARQGLERDAARALQLLGNVALAQGRFDAADEYWRQSLERWLLIEDRLGEAQVRSGLAMAAARRGQLGDARAELERSLRLREEAGDVRGTSACLHNLAFVFGSAGGLREAAATYERCLKLRRALGDRYHEASAANNLGWILVELGRPDEARRQLEHAQALRRELGDRRGEAQTLANLAELDLRVGQLGRAMTQAAQAQRIRDELGHAEDALDSARRGARIQLVLGEPERARRAAEAAVRGSRETGLSLEEAPSRLLLGEVLARAGQRPEARRELERARRCAERVGDQLTSRAASIELAGLHLALGEPDLARARLDSRAVPRPGRLDPFPGCGLPDRYGQLRVRERLLRALIELAREAGSVSTAARCAEEALSESRRAGLRDLEWRALYARAAVAELRERSEEALSLTLEAQEIVEVLLAAVPREQQETYLSADPVRAAALRGDSPLASLRVAAGRSDSDMGVLQELRAMSPRVPAPTIEPPRRSTAAPSSPTPEPVRESSTGAVAREDFAALVRLNRSIVDEPDVQRSYDALVREAARLCRGERAYLAVFGDSPDQLAILATHALDDLSSPKQRFARRCGYKAAETGQLVLSADVHVDAELKRRAQVLGLGLRSIVAAPVRTPDRQRGVLFVDHGFQTGHFRAREVELLEVLADQCAMAVGRAALESALHERQGVHPGVPLQQLLRAKAAAERPALLRTVARFGVGAQALVGRSPALAVAVSVLDEFAPTQTALLIEGPPGVGKGVVARAVHAASGREGPLVVVDVRELPEQGFEPELFGHEVGAFAGADVRRLGLIRSAEGGTLLLERLDEAPLALQAALVRALEERRVRPAGADASTPFDVRILATAGDADGATERGELSQELSSLVAQARVTIPALDERPEDKAPLLDALLEAWEGEPPQLPGPVRAALIERAYPGNARELNAVLRAAAARARGRPLTLQDLPRARARRARSLAAAMREFERATIQRALRAHEGDLTAAATELGLTRRGLQTKLRQLGLAT